MKTYLEIKVPISYDDPWFEELRNCLSDIPVRWQKDFYHITMVFINETPKDIDLRPMLRSHLSKAEAPTLTFDQLDAFSTRSGMVVHLSASQVPEEFLSLTESIRSDMKNAGCLIPSNFMLHVTLGRIKSYDVKLSYIKKLLASVSKPSFTLTLTDVDYREFRGRTIYKITLK